MGRGGIPLRPPAGPAAAPVPLIPGIPDGKAQAHGPLGARAISPNLLQKLQELRQQPAPGSGGIQMGGEAQPATQVREIPEQPSALDYEAKEPTPAPAQEKEQKEPEKKGAPDGAGGILDNVAMTGMEFKANPILARDDEFLADIWWMSDPERRKEIDARADPIDWNGFAVGMDITQRVLMWTSPMPLYVTFRKVKGDDEMLSRKVLRKLYDGSDAEREVGLLITTAAASVVQVGDRRLPPVPSPLERDPKVAATREDVFMERVKIASTFDMTLLRDLVINYAWFSRRAVNAVRGKGKESLGNG